MHLKLSSITYSTQLLDMFSYETPNTLNLKNTTIYETTSSNIIVYNFHSIKINQKFFLFIKKINKNFNKNPLSVKSITELFLNSNWLEREISELHGFFFSGKKDTRNLLLQYGDTSSPMKKSFPSIGLREVFYSSNTDTLIQSKVSIQF